MSSAAPSRSPGAWQVTLRVAAALPGSYALVWGVVNLVIAALVASGVAYDQASLLAMLLSFVLFLVLLLWSIAARSLLRVWLVLAGGAVSATLVAHWLTARLAGGEG